MAACGQCGKANPDDARFCAACGSELQAPQPERRKVATILFCDVVESTALAERVDPETIRAIMVRYFDRSRRAIERHGGTVEKFIGDAVMAVFGVPVTNEDDAVRAVRAAAELQAGVEELNREIEPTHGCRIALRIGVNTGEVVTGDSTARQSVVIGDAVNVAARLQQHAGEGETLVGEATYRLVRDVVEAEPVAPIGAKGKAKPLRAVRLVSVDEDAALRPARPGAPMVGREIELAALRAAYDQAAAIRRCRLVAVVGEPGVGKSRLADELVAGLGGRATVVGGRCLSYGEGTTYWPLRDILERAAGLQETVSVERARESIVALLAGAEHGHEAALALAQAVGLADGSASADDIAWATRRLFETIAHERPLVVQLEDLHWAKPAFLDLVERVAAQAVGPILVLGLGRTELLDQRPDWQAVRLSPLRPEEADLLAESLLPRGQLSPEARRRAIESAGGNPLFMEELLAMLLETPDLEAPPTLEALLAARLDRLPAAERSTAECAAVEGQVFHRGAVEVLSGGAEGIDEALRALEAKELVRSAETQIAGQAAYRFRHILIRDAAYRGLPKRLRAELHEAYARWLERVAGERVGEYAEILGFHLEEAFNHRAELGPVDAAGQALGAEAARWLSTAANRAFGRGDMRAAAGLLQRAVSLLEGDPAAHLELLPELSKALRYSGDVPGGTRVLEEASVLATTVADARLRARVSVEGAFLALYTRPDVEAGDVIATAEEAAALFQQVEDGVGLARAWNLVGHANWYLCRAAAMEEAFERGLAEMARAGDYRERWWIITQLLCAAVFGPARPDEGIRRCHELLDRGDRVQSLEMTADAAIASLEAMRGNVEAARALIGRSRSIAEDLGLRQWLGALANFAGPIELFAGDLPAAERELRRGYAQLEELGETAVLSTTAAFLARTLVLTGRLDEAEQLATTSIRLGARDDVYTQVVCRGALARVHAGRGQLGRAGQLAGDAVARAAATDFLVLRGESLLDLAEVQRVAGRTVEAESAASEALELFDAKGCTVLADSARTLLDPGLAPTVRS